MIVTRIAPQDWKVLSARAHLAVFEKNRDPEMERIDFALIMEEGEMMTGYCTCREFDSETLYIAYGGVFHDARKTSLSLKTYQSGIAWVKERYKRMTTLIENDNIPMLKMAFHEGLRVMGVRYFKGQIFLELQVEFV